ncbi:MAG: hypothetical protein O3A33_01735 [Chloroflexi bacterium]|nr:hypothetical protein [Chloroflexota bacterium]
MYQIKIFSAATPIGVEQQANEWLKSESGRAEFRVVTVSPTDVVQLSAETGIQRYTVVMLYEQSDDDLDEPR